MKPNENKIRPLVLPDIKKYLLEYLTELERQSMTVFESEGIKPTGKDELVIEHNKLNKFRNDFSVFKTLIKRIQETLDFPINDSSKNLKIAESMAILKKRNIYDGDWIRIKEIARVLSSDERVSQDEENSGYILKAFEDAGVNIDTEIKRLFIGFTKHKISKYLKLNDYMPKNMAIDFSADHPKNPNGLVLFEIREVRQRAYTPERDHIFQLYDSLKKADEYKGSVSTRIVLIVFSVLPPDEFETLTFKFQNFAKQLDIPSSYLQRMTLIPASFLDPNNIQPTLQKYHNELNTLSMSYDFESNLEEKINDEILPQFYEVRDGSIGVRIDPQRTKFWRFGFVLSDEQIFTIDRSVDDRHANPNTIDIHVCVGDREINGEWINPNMVYLTHYKIEPTVSKYKVYTNYNQETVHLNLRMKDNELAVELTINGQNSGERVYIHNKKYIHFVAWCDFKPYNLMATFQISYLSNKRRH